MMATKPFFRGSIWSDGATPPAAKVLTTGYVVGNEVFLDRETLLSVVVALSGTAPTSVDLRLEQSFDGSTWTIITPPGPATLDGEDVARYMLTPHCYYRFSAKRTGGDGTTALLALGYTTEPEAFPGKVDEDGALLTAGTATVSGDVAHDAADSGNPVKVGAHARNAERTAVDNDDRVDLTADLNGELVIAGHDWTNDALKTSTAFVAGTATNVNGGNRDAGTQTVTLADDDPATVSLGVMDDWDNAASDGASVSGDVAHDAVDAGEPVKQGFRARTSQNAAVANDDRVDGVANANGEQVMAGHNWTSNAHQIVGEVADDAVDAGAPISIGGIARSAQRAAVAALDRVKATFNVYGEMVLAAYDWTLNSLRSTETNPLSEHYAADDLVETNITTNTTTYYYMDMAGYRYFAIQGETSGTTPTDVLTVTVEASVQDDGTAAASCDYQDVTNALFGVASWVDTDFLAVADTANAFKYVRVKYVTSNDAGNDADLTLYTKRMH